MVDQTNNTGSKNEAPLVTWTEFLESHPPGRQIRISGLVEYKTGYGPGIKPYARTPDINLYCDDSNCEGMRLFEHVKGDRELNPNEWTETFIYYRCKNCEKSYKRFALAGC